MIRLTDRVLKDAIISRAKNLPLATANAIAFNLKQRSVYMLSVLQSSSANQTAVRNAAAASSSPGRRDLAAILTAFAALSSQDKAAFITAFRRRAALAVTGINFVSSNQNSWSWGSDNVIQITDGTVIGIKAVANGKYVTAENAGTSPLIANRDAIGGWEQFQVFNQGNGYVALLSLAAVNRQYVCAENAGNDSLIANRTIVGGWEQFKLISTGAGNFAMIAMANGKYVCAENAGSDSLIANRSAIGGWEQFSPVLI